MKWPWLLVLVLWIMTTYAITQTTQGTYEDTNYVHALTGAPAPTLLAARGLGQWTLWYQINHGLTPVAIRWANVALGTTVALLTGLLASQLGLWSWLATGLMIVHPLAIETIATMTGRLELIAACGLLLALTLPWPFTLLALALGLMGKESAIVGIVVVPLLWGVRARQPIALMLAVGGGLTLLLSAWTLRHAGVTVMATHVNAWEWARLQGAASWRLLTLTVLPIHQTIDFDYDALSRFATWAACLCLLSVAYLAWTLRQGNALMATCLTWMLCVSAPRLIIQTPKSYLNEHQWYLALPAFALLVCAGAQRLTEGQGVSE
jgi:hypothetical protein